MTDPSAPQQPNPYGQPATPQPTYDQAAAPAPAYGQPAQYSPGYALPYAPPAQTSTLAIVALILGLVGAFIPGSSIAAIITGHIALSQLKTSGQGGHGMALAGTILGWVLTGIGLLAIIGYVIFIVVIVGVAATNGSYSS